MGEERQKIFFKKYQKILAMLKKGCYNTVKKSKEREGNQRWNSLLAFEINKLESRGFNERKRVSPPEMQTESTKR